mmetsp:Transcript_18667/g.20298  ORF Transcript_18667/g.20298 Transcript_18667/m.20298 type:complete len:191 (-) Transcript_18667:3998-4570(-)|eukprot:CAMPEP_0173153428 /NCGR_PEP_ID=MMETSP1105-20130129/12853_1 /TAXON_ID=2985 /ORGANISM="Ochromonas sp., Strain BG-1" /LENGTH=190 /DNA_ID=CAMNT_0014069359 /DNA_START=39 /DNA_END=611 /DNA_ORIENTATION=-
MIRASPIIFQENNENSYPSTKLKGKTSIDQNSTKKGLSSDKSKPRKALSSLSTSQINIRSNTIELEGSKVKKISAVNDVPKKLKTKKEEYIPDVSEMVCSSNSSNWLNEDPYDEVHRLSKKSDIRILPFIPEDFSDLPSNEVFPEFDLACTKFFEDDSALRVIEDDARQTAAHTFLDFSYPLDLPHSFED